MRQALVGIKSPDEHWEFLFGQEESILCSMISYRYTLSLEGDIGAGTLYQRSPGIQAFRYFGPYHVAFEIMKASDAGPGTGKLNDSYSDQPSYTLRSGYEGENFEGWLSCRYDNSKESFKPEDLDKHTSNAGWLFTGEAEWRLKPVALYGTWYVGEGSAYPHIFRQFEDDGGSLENLILINSKEDKTRGAMVGVRSTINKLSLALSAGYTDIEDKDGSWTDVVGRDTEGESLGQTTYRLVTKYQLGEPLWVGLEFVYAEISGMPEAKDYKGQSFLMHVNYSF
jgi:predicted porin